MATPKKISDLAFETVFIVSSYHEMEAEARKFFNELYENEGDISINQLFSEDGDVVYEAYQDSGSVDYIYFIIK